MKKHIPNTITLLNLLAGCVAIVMILEDQPRVAVYLVLAAALFDFLDGTAARKLDAYSRTGKVLDSLADMVSFGVVPALFVYKIFLLQLETVDPGSVCAQPWVAPVIQLSPLLIPALAAIRLARFSVHETRAEHFSGLPVPAHTLFWTGIFYEILTTGALYGQTVYIWFTWVILVMFSVMMIIPLPMISLKFHHFRFRGNRYRYIILAVGLAILLVVQLPGLPLVILTYILLSLFRIVLT